MVWIMHGHFEAGSVQGGTCGDSHLNPPCLFTTLQLEDVTTCPPSSHTAWALAMRHLHGVQPHPQLTALTAATKAGWSASRTRKVTMDTSSWSAAQVSRTT